MMCEGLGETFHQQVAIVGTDALLARDRSGMQEHNQFIDCIYNCLACQGWSYKNRPAPETQTFQKYGLLNNYIL
jgi:hypothetical protein